MGRQSRMHRERRLNLKKLADLGGEQSDQNAEKRRIKEKLTDLIRGGALLWSSSKCPPEIVQTHMEDVIAFESVGSGVSLFEGLQQNGIDLPPPDELDEYQSARKVMEITVALEDIRVFLIGMEGMSAKEAYRTLWDRTLWEGCYVKKRLPGSVTVIDVSRKLSRSKVLGFLQGLAKAENIH